FNISVHLRSLICQVLLMGRHQVTPSSSLFTNMPWPVSSGVMPASELFQSICPGLPCAHKAITHIVLVKGSTKMEGSPMPFSDSGLPPNSFMSIMTFMRSHVCPPSVLLLRPTSMSPCMSTELSRLIS